MLSFQEIIIKNKARKAIENYMKNHGDEVDSTYGVNGASFFGSFSKAEAEYWIEKNAGKILRNKNVTEELRTLLEDFRKANAIITVREQREQSGYDFSL